MTPKQLRYRINVNRGWGATKPRHSAERIEAAAIIRQSRKQLRAATEVKKGLRFRHRRVLDPMHMPEKVHATYEVTRIALGMVYYRPVYDYGTRECLGSPECIQLEKFASIVLEG